MMKVSASNRAGMAQVDRYDDWNKLSRCCQLRAASAVSPIGACPDLYQLASLVRCRGGSYKNLDNGCTGSYQRPTIDTNYFPNTKSYVLLVCLAER